MKKPKLRLDKAAIQEFFLQNVEKIAFGLLALVFLYFVYAAVEVKHYDKTPDGLNTKVRQGQTTLDDTKPITGLVVRDYDVQVKQNSIDIAEKPYGPLANWDPPIFRKPELRDTPALYAVQGLRGTAGFGAMTMIAEQPADPHGQPAAVIQGATAVQGQRWIVLTGLVPYDKELAAFDDALKHAGPTGSYSSERDTPYYLGYEVERVEVVSPADAAKPNWDNAKKIQSGRAVQQAQKRWNQQQAAEVVAQTYIFLPNVTALVFPLGPLVGSTWGESAAHSREIPLLDLAQPGVGVAGMVRPPVAPGPQPAGGALGGDNEDPYGGGTPGVEPAAPAGGAAGEGPAAAAAATSPYLLFRFFDFDVQPGKQYTYRVQLGLRNPNYKKFKVKPAWLKDPKLGEEFVLKTKWSDDSDPPPVISVPGDTRILLVSVAAKPARPEGRILVTKWSKKYGVEAHKEFSPIVRGEVVDFPEEIFKPAGATMGGGGGMVSPFFPPGAGGRGVPGAGRVGAGGLGGGPATLPGGPGGMPPGMPRGDPRMMPPMRPQGPVIAANANRPFRVNYFTHTIVVDLRGGELLRGRKGGNGLRLAAPSDMLLQDAEGNLVVRDELDDLPACGEVAGNDTPEEFVLPARPKAAHGGAPGKGGPLDQMPTPREKPKKTSGKSGKTGGNPKKPGR